MTLQARTETTIRQRQGRTDYGQKDDFNTDLRKVEEEATEAPQHPWRRPTQGVLRKTRRWRLHTKNTSITTEGSRQGYRENGSGETRKKMNSSGQ